MTSAREPKRQGIRRSHEEVSRDRTEISYMLLKGMKPTAIADALQKPVGFITNEIVAIEQEWLNERVLNVTALRNRELHRLAHLEMRAWQGFERSGEPLKSTRTRQRSSEKKKRADGPVEQTPPDGMPHLIQDPPEAGSETNLSSDTEATVRIEEKNPDPRFLMVIERIIEQRIRLLGLEAAPQGEDPNNIEPIREVVVFVTEGQDVRGLNGRQPEPEEDEAQHYHDVDATGPILDMGELPAPEDSDEG